MRTRILLIVWGIVSICFLVTPLGFLKYYLSVYILLVLIAAGVAYLAYRFALQLGRNGIVWAICCFIFPAIAPIILAFMKHVK
jgi:hypothetical protein